jgi:hypothetical protein
MVIQHSDLCLLTISTSMDFHYIILVVARYNVVVFEMLTFRKERFKIIIPIRSGIPEPVVIAIIVENKLRPL